MFSLFKTQNTAQPSAEAVISYACVELATNLGLDSERAAQVTHFAQTIFRSGNAQTCLHAIKRGEAFALLLANLDADNERHSNIGKIPTTHYQGINERDQPACVALDEPIF